MRWRTFILCAAAILTIRASGADVPSIVAPGQPSSGHGGSDYRHAAVRQTKYGHGALEYHLFEPAEPSPQSAPVVIFLHGWTAVDPWLYGAWIEHLARRGNIVIHPRYQVNALTRAADFTPNALKATRSALAELANGHVRPDTGRLAIAGHSVGGLLTANVAALAGAHGLPAPRALMCVQPGRSSRGPADWSVRLEDLSAISDSTLLLCVTGECDLICGDTDAKRILAGARRIPAIRKNLVILSRDDHGNPPMTASHLAPCSVPAQTFAGPEADGEEPAASALIAAAVGDFAPLRVFLQTPGGRRWKRLRAPGTPFAEAIDPPNTQDFALWRMFDALCEGAFDGKITVDTLAMSPRSLTIGSWSDGTPVKPLRCNRQPAHRAESGPK